MGLEFILLHLHHLQKIKSTSYCINIHVPNSIWALSVPSIANIFIGWEYLFICFSYSFIMFYLTVKCWMCLNIKWKLYWLICQIKFDKKRRRINGQLFQKTKKKHNTQTLIISIHRVITCIFTTNEHALTITTVSLCALFLCGKPVLFYCLTAPEIDGIIFRVQMKVKKQISQIFFE